MDPEIHRRFEKLERQKHALLAATSPLTPAQLSFRPQAAGWSTTQVLDHLVKTEKASLEAVRTHLPGGPPPTARERFGALVVLLVMNSPIRVKVPPSVTTVLPEETPSRIASRWNEVRLEMADLLQSLDPAQLHRGLFRHPVSGWMTMPQALAFLSAHLRHHGYQLGRLRSAMRRQP